MYSVATCTVVRVFYAYLVYTMSPYWAPYSSSLHCYAYLYIAQGVIASISAHTQDYTRIDYQITDCQM